MDPLTHTLVGASLAATRLADRTRRAGAALVIGVNLPDLDVLAYAAGEDFALGFRRGWTHGLPALAVLPALLAALLWIWDRRQAGADRERPFSPGRICALCYLAAATHPLLDWMNTYGMRWWMPFRDTWSYGDSLFIMDPWLWLLLGAGWLVGRRATGGLLAGWAAAAGLVCLVVASRAPAYLPVVGAVAGALLCALLWRPEAEGSVARRAATAGLVLATLYVLSLLALHELTERRVRLALAGPSEAPLEQLMVGPAPADPLRWEIVARQGGRYRFGDYSWGSPRRMSWLQDYREAADTSETWPGILGSGQARGFLRWVRFPWLEVEGGSPRRVYIMDARYTRRRTRGFGGAAVLLP